MITCPSCNSPHWDSGTVCSDCGRPHGRDARAKIAQDIALVRAELESKLYVPGQWICAKCEFVLMKSIMHAQTGNVGVNLAQEREPCPRCGWVMSRMTWEWYALDARATALSQMDRALKAEAERDALGVRRLAAERKLEEISRGNPAEGGTKGQDNMKRRLLLNQDGADGNGPAEEQKDKAPTPQPEAKPRIDGITAKMSGTVSRNGNSEQVQLHPVYAENGVNKKWAQYTPSGQLSLTIDNPEAQGFIQPGKEYIISIREAQPGE